MRKGERGTTVVYADCFVPDDEKQRQMTPAAKRAPSRSSNASPSSTPRSATTCRRTSWRLRPSPTRPDRALCRGAHPRDEGRLPHRRRPRLQIQLSSLPAAILGVQFCKFLHAVR